MQNNLSAWLGKNAAVLDENANLVLPQFNAQLQAAADGRAYSPLTRYTVLTISGDDATSFLQGQFSCDVAAIAANGVTLGSYSTAKGRMQASFVLAAMAGIYYLVVRQDIAEVFRRRLSMFVLRAKVSIADASASLQPWLVQLPASALPAVTQQGATGLAMNLGNGIGLQLLPHGEAPAPEEARQAVGSMAAELVFIRAGLGWVSHATYEEFVPQMLNLELIGGISFKKGCYPGQEIVARTQYLGKVKRRMYRALISGAASLAEGAALVAHSTGDQVIGRVVQLCQLEENRFEVLLVIQRAAWDDGVRLQDDQAASIEKLTLPYDFPDAD